MQPLAVGDPRPSSGPAALALAARAAGGRDWARLGRGGSMARIPCLDPDRAPESVKRLLAPDRPQKIALLFGHAESNWPRLADLLLSILGEQELESRLRELGILRIANLRQARYEWDQHVVIAGMAGVRPEQIESIAKGRIDAACFDPRERLLPQA